MLVFWRNYKGVNYLFRDLLTITEILVNRWKEVNICLHKLTFGRYLNNWGIAMLKKCICKYFEQLWNHISAYDSYQNGVCAARKKVLGSRAQPYSLFFSGTSGWNPCVSDGRVIPRSFTMCMHIWAHCGNTQQTLNYYLHTSSRTME